MKSKITILLFLVLISCSIARAAVTLEEDLRPDYAVNITNEGGSRASVANIVLQMIAGSLIYVAGPLAVYMIALGGFNYIIANGDETKMDEAKKSITYAIVGLIVIILSWAIITNVIKILTAGGISGTDI